MKGLIIPISLKGKEIFTLPFAYMRVSKNVCLMLRLNVSSSSLLAVKTLKPFCCDSESYQPKSNLEIHMCTHTHVLS